MKDIYKVGDINKRTTHSDCGGKIKVTGFCFIGPADVEEWQCLKCGSTFDGSDYEEFEETK